MGAWLASLPDTVRTHGGRHLWFWAPAGTQGGPAFKRPGQSHDGLDLKSAGGYARETAWTGAGEIAEPTRGGDLAALDAGRGAGGRAPTPAAASGSRGVPEMERGDEFLRANGFDPDVVRADAARWLETKAPLPTEGTGGATLMVVFGALLVGFGLDDAVALDLVCEVYTPRAWPGRTPTKRASATRSTRSTGTAARHSSRWVWQCWPATCGAPPSSAW
jgi:hypothetical protein